MNAGTVSEDHSEAVDAQVLLDSDQALMVGAMVETCG
jgi:hypothetical protein